MLYRHYRHGSNSFPAQLSWSINRSLPIADGKTHYGRRSSPLRACQWGKLLWQFNLSFNVRIKMIRWCNKKEYATNIILLQVCDDPKEAALKLAEEIADNSGPIAVRTLVKTLREKQNQGLAVIWLIKNSPRMYIYYSNHWRIIIMLIISMNFRKLWRENLKLKQKLMQRKIF